MRSFRIIGTDFFDPLFGVLHRPDISVGDKRNLVATFVKGLKIRMTCMFVPGSVRMAVIWRHLAASASKGILNC